ncbi:MAG: S8 family serine peptidase [Armatimonadota bacterium]
MNDESRLAMIFPDANSRHTYFTLHNIREAQVFSKGKGCKVGILDHSFGIELHPELYSGGKNFVSDDDEVLAKHESHGYWMTKTLREIAPEVEIYALNTYSFEDPDSHAEIISRAIDWAIQQHIDVLTYSHAAVTGEARQIFDDALNRAHSSGIITTFIHTGHLGNIMPYGLFPGEDDGREPDIHILHYDYSVVMVDEYWKLKDGEPTWWNPPFLSFSSTSPVLGGVVSMMRSVNPNLKSDQCRKLLRETAYPLEFEGRQVPRALDALAAVKQAKASFNL